MRDLDKNNKVIWLKVLNEHVFFETRKSGKKVKIGDLGFWLA